jgi:hypothetical protein
MNKEKFYRWVIAGLLVSNLFLAVFLFSRSRPPKPFDPDTPKRIIAERLHFDKNQIVQYESLIQEHRKQVRTKDEEIRKLKNELYSLLPAENIPVKKDSLISLLAEKQKEVEYIHYNHFADIKKLCKPTQMADYNLLVKEINTIFNRPPKPRK